MPQDSLLPFDLPAVAGKKVSVAFDGGKLSSDAGVLLLRAAECKLAIAERLAACLRDARDPARIQHTIADMLRFRLFAIAAGDQDADDCDALRDDPADLGWRRDGRPRAAIPCARSRRWRGSRTLPRGSVASAWRRRWSTCSATVGRRCPPAKIGHPDE
jgi:hypothetical protein